MQRAAEEASGRDERALCRSDVSRHSAEARGSEPERGPEDPHFRVLAQDASRNSSHESARRRADADVVAVTLGAHCRPRPNYRFGACLVPRLRACGKNVGCSEVRVWILRPRARRARWERPPWHAGLREAAPAQVAYQAAIRRHRDHDGRDSERPTADSCGFHQVPVWRSHREVHRPIHVDGQHGSLPGQVALRRMAITSACGSPASELA